LKNKILLFTILGFFNSVISAELIQKYEIGWEDGIRLGYRGLRKINIGFLASPNYTYSDDFSTAFQAGTTINNGNTETKSIYVGLQCTKEIIHKFIYLEPYVEIGYGYTLSESHLSQSSGNISAYSNTDETQNRGLLQAGLKPGLIIKNSFKIYTSLGILASGVFRDIEIKRENNSSFGNNTTTEKRKNLIWRINDFGSKASLSSGFYVSYLF